MGKERTDKSRFKSRYTVGEKWITLSQWAAEFACERKALHDKKKLVIEFWKDIKWRNYFQRQVSIASKLIKEFGPESLLAALRRTDLQWVHTLDAPVFKRAVKDESLKPSKPIEHIEKVEIDGEAAKVIPAAKPNILQLLDE